MANWCPNRPLWGQPVAENTPTAVESSVIPMRPGRNGGRLLVGGRKGQKGSGGRPADIYVALCAALVTSDDCQNAVLAIIRNPDHPGFVPLYRVLTDRAFGKVTEKIDLNASVAATIRHEPLSILLPKLDPAPERLAGIISNGAPNR